MESASADLIRAYFPLVFAGFSLAAVYLCRTDLLTKFNFYIIHMKKSLIIAAAAGVAVLTTGVALANHSWGSYHWARTANPLALKLGDNVSSVWDSYLASASTDWTASDVLDTTVVAGATNPKNCKAVRGRVEICNSRYGNNGWLGLASIWASGDHITQGTVKFNDTYFAAGKYNTPAWRQSVVCQEVGHALGLDHQDEVFTNLNLGTCMDYSNDPTGTAGTNGTLANLNPNAHDYDELEAIYAHLDSTNTALATVTGKGAAVVDTSNPTEWGKLVRASKDGRGTLYERDLGHGEKLFTFVIWAR